MAEKKNIKTVMFASGDVGGARALMPVMMCCHNTSTPFLVVENGHILSEIPDTWDTAASSELSDMFKVKGYYQEHNIGALVFSSSVNDLFPLRLARWSKHIGIPVIHVLDSWSQYRRRLEMDGWPALKPDVYTVMDDLAYREALRNDIDRSSLKITGQPALSGLLEEFQRFQQRSACPPHYSAGGNGQPTFILFVSEPALADQGADDSHPSFRGYTEQGVIKNFLSSVQMFSDRVNIGILPHPREERDDLIRLWEKYRGNLNGQVLGRDHARQSLFLADGIAGMASIMLYEGWLLGKPVISLQPGLRLASLRMFEKRKGMVFVDSLKPFPKVLNEWIESISPDKKMVCRPDTALHKKAPENVFAIIETILEQGLSGESTQPRRAL